MQTQKKHMIDILFPIILFFIFAISAIIVLLLAANVYRSTAKGLTTDYLTGTSLAYVSEKIHQNNEAGAISIGTLGHTDAVVIRQHYEDKPYCTYIYFYDGALRELFVREGTDVSPADGTEILELEAFTIEPISDSLIRFTARDARGQSNFAIVSFLK